MEALLLEACFDGMVISMLKVAFLDGAHSMRMLLRKDLAILDRLYGSVVMVLVNLTVDGRGSFLMTVFGNVLVHNGWGHLFVNGGIMMTRLVPDEKEINIWGYCTCESSICGRSVRKQRVLDYRAPSVVTSEDWSERKGIVYRGSLT